ncbi:hypothetical protein L195_g044758 [Trifolium pratense]|uniref:Uncharacterized protein n=1 Tax=Trifolium pratense TaxID=57577 RepID=A0A2K3MCZ7_TRIPR|nr:hypothetical protein L195_g044758 [Trifolium pratense]
MLILILTLPLRTEVNLKPLKETIPEKDAAHDATTSAAQEYLENIVVLESPDNVIIPDNVFDDNTVVISQSDESIKTVSEHLEDEGSAKKDEDADLNVIDVDNLNSRESLAEETPAEPKKKSLKRK